MVVERLHTYDRFGNVLTMKDALGLTTYAYAPEISAIMQSGNLYVYCGNSPIQYCDSTGDIAELVILGIPVAIESIFAALGLTAMTGVLIFSDFRRDFGEAMQYTLELMGKMIQGVGSVVETLSIEYVRPQLPSIKKVKIDMEHIMSGHSFGGKRGGPNKDRFPWWMTEPMIEKAIREAYQTAEKIGSLQCSWQDGVWTIRQLFQGTSGGMFIRFWFNFTTNTIETGWPV
mgnify:CR=1 FL=1